METVNIGIFALDNDPDELEFIKRVIDKVRNTNYKLFTIEEELLDILTEDIHVYIVDHSLTLRTGLDVLKIIKEKSRDSYVIAYTGYKNPDVIIAYIKNKVDDWVDKNAEDQAQQLEIAVRKGIETAAWRISFANHLNEKIRKYDHDQGVD